MGPEAGRGLIPFLFGSLIFSPNYDLTPDVIDNPQLPGTRQNPENNGINYQPQLVSSISAIGPSFLLVFWTTWEWRTNLSVLPFNEVISRILHEQNQVRIIEV